MDNQKGTDRWGIDDQYLDVSGQAHPISTETRAAFLQAMGVAKDGGGERDAVGATAEQSPPWNGATYADVVVLRGKVRWSPDRGGKLDLEDGSSRAVKANEQLELPLGYHTFHAEERSGPGGGASSRAPTDDRTKPIRVIAAPETCYLPDDLRMWGWAAQLYATRSRDSWGIGDLTDLKRLADWSRGLGARCLMLNPLSAVTSVLPLEASPYYPSSRRFRNPIYIDAREAPGAQELGELFERLGVNGRGLNSRRQIERDAVFTLKMQALEACFEKFRASTSNDDFEAYRRDQGQALHHFSVYAAIAERQGKDWRRWPNELQRPDARGVAAFAEANSSRVTFHAWLQWLLDRQLAQASRDICVIQDLPIGLDVAGADAWCWQDLLAQGVSVGAPPDQYNPGGQDWGLTPFVPHKLRGMGYQPLVETIRATARHAGGLRIDHVMGLFRLYWIGSKAGGGAANGAMVRTNADELLGVIALESHRAKAFVVGEDLGTVEDGVRAKLTEFRVLSNRLMYFENDAPTAYPELALSAITTHDLPTIAGLASGADIARSQKAGVPQNEAGLVSLRDKIAGTAGVAPDVPAAQLIEKAYAALAAAPSRVLLASLDDAFAVEERPNLPGAAPDWPNWSMALPVAIDDFPQQELPRRIAAALGRG